MKKILIIALCAMGIAWSITDSRAATITLNFNSASADYMLGTVAPANQNDVASQVIYLNQLLSMGINTATRINYGSPIGNQAFARSDLSSSGLPALNGLSSVTTSTTSAPSISVDSIKYIVAKYGNQDTVWYIGNLAASDQVQVPSVIDTNTGTLSNITTWGNNTAGTTSATTTSGATSTTPSGTTVTPVAATSGTTVTPAATTSGITAATTATTGAAKVPEPGTILLLGLGFLSLAGLRRKFQKSNK